MAQDVVLAVAGSGKTRLLIDRLNTEDRFLLITYTTNNFINLRERVIDKFGCVPDNIRLSTYFEFLYGFCIRPIFGDELSCKGINWEPPLPFTQKLSREDWAFYRDKNDYLYHNRMAKLLDTKKSMQEVLERIGKYYDCVLIDEVQDFGGHDLNFICALAKADFDILIVGDFYQHTFDTSKDGNTNRTIYNHYEKYFSKLNKSGLTVDREVLAKSYRCSPDVCAFVQTKLGIQMESNREDRTTIQMVDEQMHADRLFGDEKIVKLFYQSQDKYPCYSENWGKSKGQDHYTDVCVVLNPKSHAAFRDETLASLPPTTKSKLYVACTRARGDLYFVSSEFYKKYRDA